MPAYGNHHGGTSLTRVQQTDNNGEDLHQGHNTVLAEDFNTLFLLVR